jgi:hypothetical protein
MKKISLVFIILFSTSTWINATDIYKIPKNGGPVLLSLEQVFEFISEKEKSLMIKPRPTQSNGKVVMEKGKIMSGSDLMKNSRVDTVNNKIGSFKIIFLPIWCGHKNSTDSVVYVIKENGDGFQVVGRTEGESSSLIDDQEFPFINCDSYHGAKGLSIQKWNGHSFQIRR